MVRGIHTGFLVGSHGAEPELEYLESLCSLFDFLVAFLDILATP